MRYQVLLQGEAGLSSGSVYFDDLNLVKLSSAPYGDMNIIWNDEFEGTAIKNNIWTYDLGNSGWGNNRNWNITPTAPDFECFCYQRLFAYCGAQGIGGQMQASHFRPDEIAGVV